MTYQEIDRVFYVLAALSAALSIGLVLSIWFS
jgi:hypothetical protein